MSSTFTIQLPAGTNVTKLVNIPTAGSWLGAVVVSWATHSANMTVHSAIFINEIVPGNVNVKGYRHVDYLGTGAPTFDNWTLNAETRIYKVLFRGESLFKINYTSTNDVSVTIETSHTAWKTNPYPQYSAIPPTLYKYDGRIEWVPK